MTHLLGIDLGTSSVKAIIIDEKANLLGTGSREYPIDTPQPGWAEQRPEQLWNATVQAVQIALHEANQPTISGIGLSGQMHGTILIAPDLQPINPAIIWADQRSAPQVEEIISLIGADAMAQTAGTAPAAGFMGPTLRWLQQHDPARLDRARYCILTKDYVRLRLTGEIATDASDASATALFDIHQRQWSRPIIDQLDLPDLWPRVLSSSDIAGQLTHSAAEALGLKPGIPVVAGCADQVAQAVGNGLIDPGIGSVTIGTGGQLFAPLAEPKTDRRLHAFCHAPPDRWYLLGATLAAGLSLRWFRDLLGLIADPNAYENLAQLAAAVPPGADGLLFLPYLVGERSPLMDPLARGAFVGLSLHHGRGHMARAIMEGVAFSLRQALDIMRGLGVPTDQLIASGNGLASPIWRQITTDVLGCPLLLSSGGARGGIGAALIAGIGIGLYNDYAETVQLVHTVTSRTDPDSARVRFYDEHYGRFLQVYPLLRPIMHARPIDQA